MLAITARSLQTVPCQYFNTPKPLPTTLRSPLKQILVDQEQSTGQLPLRFSSYLETVRINPLRVRLICSAYQSSDCDKRAVARRALASIARYERTDSVQDCWDVGGQLPQDRGEKFHIPRRKKMPKARVQQALE